MQATMKIDLPPSRLRAHAGRRVTSLKRRRFARILNEVMTGIHGAIDVRQGPQKALGLN